MVELNFACSRVPVKRLGCRAECRRYHDCMIISMATPSTADLPAVVDAVATWQSEGAPIQVHPGDLGWYERFGSEALAASLRVWTRGNDLLAVGFLDESELIRMAIAPAVSDDEKVALRISDDFVDALGEVLPSGSGVVEARFGHALRHVLTDRGWTADDSWTPLHLDLSLPAPPCLLRVEVVVPGRVEDRIAVGDAAFHGSTLTAGRWRQMARGHAYQNAACLVGYDAEGEAVAATTVWSAGHGRPGVIEPLGVHLDYRGRGHGVAMVLAAATAMRQMGCSSATVATPSANKAAVATYQAAGFTTSGEVSDFRRP